MGEVAGPLVQNGGGLLIGGVGVGDGDGAEGSDAAGKGGGTLQLRGHVDDPG